MRLLVVLALVSACGDNLPPPDVLVELNDLPGVTATEWTPPSSFKPEPGYRYFDLAFETPIDHGAAAAGTFQLHATLMHRDAAAPLVVYVGGYDLGFAYDLTEPAALVDGNQVELEYRFYGASIPGDIPWPELRVAQWTADQHAIVQELATIYSGARIATGGSKGGENALQQAMAHPEDYAGVVAYVPPVITAYPDERYEGILDRVGDDPACTQALRAVSRELLVRRATLEPMFAATAAYDVAGVSHAFETAVVELEFSFWMTRGIGACDEVPATTEADADLASFLEQTSPPEGYDDATLATSGSQYLYQDHVELGYPVWDHAYLDDLLEYSYEDWSAYMPPDQPTTYDPTGALALADWVTNRSQHVMLVGGQWDPWGAGYPPVAPGRDAFEYIAPEASHWSTFIGTLAPADESAAVATLAGWAGVTAARITTPTRPMAEPSNRALLRVSRDH